MLQHLLCETARKQPRQPAVIHGETVFTYAELEDLSSRLAAALAQLGVKSGDRVGILLPKSPEAVIAIYGILKTGGIYVPLDPLAPARRLAGIVDRCQINALVASTSLVGSVVSESTAAWPDSLILVGGGEIEGKRCLDWGKALATSPEPVPPVKSTDCHPAYILHTSGSTGVPKGVVISHHNALAFVRMATSFFGITKEDRIASHAPFHFDLSVFDLFTAAEAGAAVVLVPDNLGVFPSRLAAFIDLARITVWNSVASVIALLSEHGRLEQFDLEAMRVVIFSGDVLSAKHLRRAMEAMPRAVFYNVYGQTEANSSTFYRVEAPPADDRWRIPIGRPFPNFEVFALDEERVPISQPGNTGELYVGGATVALGYWQDPERTAASFVENPLDLWPGRFYRTGDLVTLDDNGDYLFLGRRDRQIKSRGYRVQIDEIDLALTSHPGVREGVAVDFPDDVLGTRILGFVQCSGPVAEVDLLDFCSECLPPYMIPERIHMVDEFPRTSTGKIDRRQLRTGLTSGTEFRPEAGE
ncbi:MAG: amino acid adenylation domain-containing protein [Desulfuromonadales bacterium]|nr:amino acid adenylation domain-containing protein [Desulfuromonadales bacterium]